MIAHVSVSPEALTDLTTAHSVPLAKALHEGLILAIEAHGLLLVANQQEELDLIQAVRDLGSNPPGARDRWITILTELRKRHRIVRLDPPRASRLKDVAALEELCRDWGRHAELAILPSHQATVLGVNADGLLTDQESHLEVASAPIAAYCQTFNALRELSGSGFLGHGQSRDTYWHTVLAPISRDARRITVLDRYLFGDAHWQLENRPRSNRWESEAVCWLLKKLDASARQGAEVLLIGGGGAGVRAPLDAPAAARMLAELWKPPAVGRLSKVEVTVAPWRNGTQHLPHDRHIRFDIGLAIKLHAGFDRLKWTTVSDPEGLGWQYLWRPGSMNALKSAEQRVLGSPMASTEVVFRR